MYEVCTGVMSSFGNFNAYSKSERLSTSQELYEPCSLIHSMRKQLVWCDLHYGLYMYTCWNQSGERVRSRAVQGYEVAKALGES